MTLQAAGPIAISQIKAEVLSGSNSLGALAAGEGFAPPHSMSEFLGYSHGPATPGLGVVERELTPVTARYGLTVQPGGGAGPQTYDLQVSRAADFGSGVTALLTGSSTLSTDYETSRESSSYTLYFRVRANAQGRQSGWAIRPLNIPAQPSGPFV